MALFNDSRVTVHNHQRRRDAAPPVTLPQTLRRHGRELRHAGRGRMAGGHLYLDHVDARAFELFLVRVTHVHAAFLLAEPLDNGGLGVVRIHTAALHGGGAVAVGEVLLAGPLEFDADQMARLPNAWRLPAPPAPPPPVRSLGVVTRIHASGKFGEITSTQGKHVFFHVSQLQAGMTVHVGQRVSYTEVLAEKGWNALDVRPA